jgi:uncharacterized protein YecT (DUF1311 family)
MPKKLTQTVIATLGVLAIEAILASLARSTPSDMIAQQLNCNNPGSNVEYKECAHRAYEQADRRLNQVYQQLRSKLSGAERKQLADAELAWIQFRDQNCSFEVYPSRGGTGYGGFLSECLERMTKQRTTDLQRYLKKEQQ